MPIIPLLSSDGFFDPAATKILIAAFDTTWQMLKTSGNVLAADYRAASTRELLAKRIIEITPTAHGLTRGGDSSKSDKQPHAKADYCFASMRYLLHVLARAFIAQQG